MIEFLVFSSIKNMWYNVRRVSSYSIDLDLEMDADQFKFTINNPDRSWTGIFSKYDKVTIKINGQDTLYGNIDKIEYKGQHIYITGRDKMSILVDNDALPSTQYNVKPDIYIKSKASEYGITKFISNSSLTVQDKLIIGTRESEISIMKNLIMEDQKRLWFMVDTIYVGDWSTNIEPEYVFTRDLPVDYMKIPIKDISLTDDGTGLSSEVRIYGSANDGKEKLVGTAKNDYLISKGIKKRKVLRSYNDDSSSKYSSNALKHIREYFRYGISVELTIKRPDNTIILPNRTARVIDNVYKMNSVFFIKGVQYIGDIRNGNQCMISMVLSDQTFDVLWQNQGTPSGSITGSSSMSVQDLMNTRK